MLIGHNFEFFGGYLVVIACYLVVTVRYCSLPGGYCSLLVVTALYHSFLLDSTFSMNGLFLNKVAGKVFKNIFFYRTPTVTASVVVVTVALCYNLKLSWKTVIIITLPI